ncbi:MAG: MBL fold metallo-hydrolase [Ruminococcaceae bacterium]|nr:MBL fold metallo-hydrolase [Oscillospiraceae bacterium]
MKRILAALLLVCLILSGCAVPAEQESPGNLVIHFIDVDQADCILMIAGETTVMIDGGNTGTSWEVLSYLQRFGVDQIDLMVNTHPHGDHLGGLPTVLNNIPTDEIWCSTTGYSSNLFNSFKKAADRQDLNIYHPAPGSVFQEGGLSVTVLGPLNSTDTYTDLNDTSLVLMVQFGQRRFLFTGDMESFAEQQLLSAHINLQADVLKVGHHGSYSSTSQAFLNAVDPDYGVISCGRNNEYGHPHDAPVNRLNRADVELYRTDLMGSVVLVTNGEELAFFLETANTNLTGYEKAA